MKKEIKIEPFTKKHVGEALEIFYEYNKYHHINFPDYYKNIDKGEEADYLKWILEEENNKGFVAIIDDKVVGFALFGLILKPSNFISPEVTYISEMIVKESYRSMGIGEKLLKKIIEYSKTRGIDKIELEITNANERGIGFYKKMGFYDYSRVMFMDI